VERIENDETFLDQLKRHEGLRLEAYLCPAGVLTIGWGHNCEAKPVPSVEKEGDVVSRGTAESLLFQDLKAIAHELDDKLPWWRKMEEPRQAVLLNMAFNMGVPSLMGFKRALGAKSDKKYRDSPAVRKKNRDKKRQAVYLPHSDFLSSALKDRHR
jgi:lysozyme